MRLVSLVLRARLPGGLMWCSQHASPSGMHARVSLPEHLALFVLVALAALVCYASSTGEAAPARHVGMMSDNPLEICDSLRVFGVPAGEWHKEPGPVTRYVCSTPANAVEWSNISLYAWSSSARNDVAPAVRLTGTYQSPDGARATVNQMTWAASAVFVRLGMSIPPVIRKTIQSPGSSDSWIRNSRITSSHKCAGAACAITVLIQNSHEKFD